MPHNLYPQPERPSSRRLARLTGQLALRRAGRHDKQSKASDPETAHNSLKHETYKRLSAIRENQESLLRKANLPKQPDTGESYPSEAASVLRAAMADGQIPPVIIQNFPRGETELRRGDKGRKPHDSQRLDITFFPPHTTPDQLRVGHYNPHASKREGGLSGQTLMFNTPHEVDPIRGMHLLPGDNYARLGEPMRVIVDFGLSQGETDGIAVFGEPPAIPDANGVYGPMSWSEHYKPQVFGDLTSYMPVVAVNQRLLDTVNAAMAIPPPSP